MNASYFCRILCCCALWFTVGRATLRADEPPSAGDAPKGEVTQYKFSDSKIFPGTVRDYWIYVPKQYDPAKPACLYVNQDAIQYRAPLVFDELIHKQEMPVTIGVFITPGRVPATDPNSLDRFNRSIEYDTPDDCYVRFLVEELLPAVEQQKTSDGRPIRLSHDGNDRAIAGASSGAICAFAAAWERPDSFRRVFSTIGTYVGLRGGDCYPTLIRKTEPKPLRVFLQDGSSDLNIYGGDWWMANQTMERALIFSGYEVNHAWGDGGHDTNQGTNVFADAMRWLWKDWPQPIKAGAGSQQLQELLVPGEGWKVAAEGLKLARAPAADAHGEVVFTDAQSGKMFRIGRDGKTARTGDRPRGVSGQAFGPSGQFFSIGESVGGILNPAVTKDAPVHAHDLVVGHDGGKYITEATSGAPGSGKILYVSPKGEQKVVDTSLAFPTGVTLSSDQSLLLVADGRSHWIYSFQVGPEGSLRFGQRFHCLHMPERADDAAPGGLAVDSSGRLYVATNMGVQVCDQAGRVNCILPMPAGQANGLCFGGLNFDTLFVTCGEQVYSRKLKVAGAPAFDEPIKPAAPRL
jgi:gluconolactonase